MYKVDKDLIIKRWNVLPLGLRDILASEITIDTVYSIGEFFHLNEDKSRKILRLVRAVFLGFVHLQDLYKEIKEYLEIDQRLALDIYHQLEQRIFSPFRREIEEVYLKFKTGVVESHQVEEPPVGPSQVVLKREKEDLTLNLKSIEVESRSEVVNEEGLLSEEKLKNEEEKKLEEKEGKLIQTTSSNSGTVLSESIRLDNQSLKTPSQEKEGVTSEIEERPIILHQEAEPISRAKVIDKFRTISFGGVLGAFKNPSFDSKSQELSSQFTQATIETPFISRKDSEEKEKIPIVVKKYDDNQFSKTIHISTFKTNLKSKEKENEEKVSYQQDSSNSEKSGKVIDLSKL